MKKILLFITVITLLVSCEKQRGTDTSKQAEGIQADASAGKYAEIVNNAVSNYFSRQKINKDKGSENSGKDNNSGRVLQTKSFKITGSGAIVYVSEGCAAGLVQFTSSGTAKANVLGTMDQKTAFCMDPVTQEIPTPPSGTATTKEGDMLFYVLTGMGVDTATGFIYQNYVFTSGTGEYSNVTGTMTLLYNVFEPTNFAYTGTGTISY